MKRVLVICGDVWHPAEIVRRGMASLCAGGYEFEFVEDGVSRWAARWLNFSVVVLAKANMVSAMNQNPWLTGDSANALQRHVQRGNGVLAIHAGTSRYEELPGMKALLGGVFEHHPRQCEVVLEPQAAHPLAAGVEAFAVQDEHYFMAMNNAGTDVFLHSRSEHGVQPAGWTRVEENGGRICVLTPGHGLEVWLHPSFQRLLLNALRWTSKLN